FPTSLLLFSFVLIPPPPSSTLFPYTTLFRSVRSFSYARRVPRALKDEYEKAVRADTSLHPAGYPQFAVRPPGERHEYVVIHYVSPYKGNERGLGLDLMADPERRQVVERTRDTGEI